MREHLAITFEDRALCDAQKRRGNVTHDARRRDQFELFERAYMDLHSPFRKPAVDIKLIICFYIWSFRRLSIDSVNQLINTRLP